MPDFTQWTIWLPWILILIGVWFLWIIIKKINAYLMRLFKPFKKGQRYRCKVLAVVDGDTIDCRRLFYFWQSVRMRLAYIDAPESKQQFGDEAKKYVEKMLKGRGVSLNVVDIDRYGRVVADVYLIGHGSVSEKLVQQGVVWVYPEYVRHPKRLKTLNQLQNEAKKHKRGLWQYSRPVNPKNFRRL